MAGRPKRRLAPDELSTVHTWLKNKIQAKWVYLLKDCDDHPAYLKLDQMEDEFGKLQWTVVQQWALDHKDLPDDERAAALEDNQRRADAMTDFCETWLRSEDWQKLKSQLRQSKVQRQNGPKKGLSLTLKASELIAELTGLDEDCANQSEAIVKYLSPIVKQLQDQVNSRWEAELKETVQQGSLLDMAGFVLFVSKQRGCQEYPFDDFTVNNAFYYIQSVYFHAGLREKFEAHWTEYQAKPGKYQGLAKRKWPELKAKEATANDGVVIK